MATKGFNKFRGIATPPSKYDSVRGPMFEEEMIGKQDRAVGQGVRGAGKIAKEALKSAIPGGVLLSNLEDNASGVEQIKDAATRYKLASDELDSAQRELEAQNRRESRGMKKGGKVKGWGIARGARKAKIY